MIKLHPQLLYSLLFLFLPLVLANTEIVNFEASEQRGAHVAGAHDWHVLSPGANEKPFTVLPAPLGTRMNSVCSAPQDLLSKTPDCAHEVWIKLDLDYANWKPYTKFTLRISWPGSSPADFGINILNPEATSSRFTGTPMTPPALTRVKFARIRVLDTGVISPLSGVTEVRPVPFIVTLEPLYLGVIPASIIPFLWTLLPVLVISAFLVPYANAYLQSVAADAKREIAGKEE
ncbi:hypothetical protein DFH05DRAFT_1406710 [Lentinula detonsa]|uniref:Uncharacterized protein n=1 Tax=Lentinula detonsa TaxID=2804962 RepID=A0A9W8NS57_9AGAR|nr:hypothetical protein DFH05DRAFT_1406710 [Lentinula detonsa]